MQEPTRVLLRYPVFSTLAPERIDDFAWENDRVAFRVYGPKAQKLLEAGNKTGVISNGIDVWSKSVSRMVVDDWYRKGDYHKDHWKVAISAAAALQAKPLEWKIEP